jgi:hypothetical protein
MDFVYIQKETGRWRTPNGFERLVRHGSSHYFAPNQLKIKFPSQSLPDRKRAGIIGFHQRPTDIENQPSIGKLFNDDSVVARGGSILTVMLSAAERRTATRNPGFVELWAIR